MTKTEILERQTKLLSKIELLTDNTVCKRKVDKIITVKKNTYE